MAFDETDDKHKVYCFVPKQTFYGMLTEAKKEDIFVDDQGRVDINKLLGSLITVFAEGRYAVVPDKPPKVQEQSTNIPEAVEKPKKIRKPKEVEAVEKPKKIQKPKEVEAVTAEAVQA